MSFTVVIPARYASTRLPGKALAEIAGKPMIAHVVDRANESSAQRVIVATDDQRIADALNDSDCDVCMTRADHVSGSDRLAEVVDLLEILGDEIIVNVQGDEPLIPGRLIDQVALALEAAGGAVMSTAARKISDPALIQDPNVVKVVFARSGRALYFSRAAIPFARDVRAAAVWHHIGIYAYRADFLKRYHQLESSTIEQTESLEQLRVLDNGGQIMVETIDYDPGVGVDTAEDLERVRKLMPQFTG
ncbi:MAG: 3-deoxy-manno-octulosonate cytidylyltransferase (CMP-KDO synthetase) [Cryomorphaceae bacterium]|jgi:3-deoxy-manno-octulosonate cytidylyltransferase (CMP-KDO synthetase)